MVIRDAIINATIMISAHAEIFTKLLKLMPFIPTIRNPQYDILNNSIHMHRIRSNQLEFSKIVSCQQQPGVFGI